MDNMSKLAAALNGHEVTDDEGNVVEETTTETPALEEKTTDHVEETTSEETVETSPTQNREDKTESTDEVAQDESGERYVPEKRFKDVYGKMKAHEREAAQAKRERDELKTKISTGQQILETTVPTQKMKAPEKADLIEIELLKTTMPEFDPMIDPVTGLPTNPKYSRELDELGTTILRANPGMTRMEAARRAKAMAENLGAGVNEVRREARTVKSQQSDSGITSRVINRSSTSKDPNQMSEKEMEAWLKANGQW